MEKDGVIRDGVTPRDPNRPDDDSLEACTEKRLVDAASERMEKRSAKRQAGSTPTKPAK